MAPIKNFSIAIVGGGIAGLTLGIALQKRNIPVDIYERAHHFREIGAGVSFSPNAIYAMDVCGAGVYGAFEKVATHNAWESKRKVYFDYYDGMANDDEEKKKLLFQITSTLGQNGLHRANFLEELVKLFPAEHAHFGKHLLDIEEAVDSGKIVLKFEDGTTAEADAVIGCDGIHSKVRKIMLGKDHPAAEPTYTHKYAYRAVVPAQIAIEALGEEKAVNASFYFGDRGHVLTFPINGGEKMNVVAFHDDPNEWTNTEKLTKWSTRESALKDFKDFGHDVTKILTLCDPELNAWAIFDLGNPLPTFYKGRIAVEGDAAHATSPHHGSGAGFAIEDSALIAELLGDEKVQTREHLEAVFATYDALRRERDQWLVKSSHCLGDAGEGMDPEIGSDWGKYHVEMRNRYSQIVDHDMQKECQEGRKELHRRREEVVGCHR